MIFTKTTKKIRVQFMPFRDGLQSSFGGKVRLNDFLPAMKRAAELGIRHFEFGGGARYQAPYFYLGEDPFEDMKAIREAVGPDVDLQILTRSVSGVTLTTQSPEGLQLQAKLMKEYGTTWDRNFDYMNDVENLIRTGKPIVDAGMHHQVCIALMGLPFKSDKVHTAEFYIDIGKRLLDSGMHIDSICLKDASGTTDPKTIYDAAVGLKKIMPPEMPLWMHTHDTASMAVACYMAAISGGADGVDLSVRPMASGTVQPDARSLNHALKGTGYELDMDVSKLPEIEDMLNELMTNYDFNPTTTTADARVLGFPMPGGAIGPNVHMMVKAGILEKYGDVLEEFPIVVEAGGAWTSVTPGSQQYWLQAFNNVMYGRWKKIDAGYGRAVLGYFGKTPLPSDPEVVKAASEQLDLPVFDGDPLEVAPKNIEPARKALEERGLPVSDKNIFLVMAAMVPGKKMELNEGIRLLMGNPKIDVPLKKKDEPKAAPAPATAVVNTAAPVVTGPVTSRLTVKEGTVTRTFTVTVEPAGTEANSPSPAPVGNPVPAASNGTPVFSTFAGFVEVVDILVKEGESINKGHVVAAVEAMKAKHDIKAPCDGRITAIHVKIGDEIDASKPILTIS
ncbi:MAG: biotin attachment protein [Candidatus Zixiibacteriota bacterium]|nr:MAG: biotin attachment protein [candidate division Zixibacteria bacterium]